MASPALALALFQDSTDTTQTASNLAAGMGVGLVLFIVLVALVFVAFFIFLFWRIFTKAGLAGPLSLLVVVPFGPLIVLCILAFSQWKVIPAPVAAPYYPPPPPPPPAFPPQS